MCILLEQQCDFKIEHLFYKGTNRQMSPRWLVIVSIAREYWACDGMFRATRRWYSIRRAVKIFSFSLQDADMCLGVVFVWRWRLPRVFRKATTQRFLWVRTEEMQSVLINDLELQSNITWHSITWIYENFCAVFSCNYVFPAYWNTQMIWVLSIIFPILTPEIHTRWHSVHCMRS